MDYLSEYRRKLKTAEDAVRVVKNGDWVEYGSFAGPTIALDRALANRKNELTNVKVRTDYDPLLPAVVEVDPEGKTFTYQSFHFSAVERKLASEGSCYYIPMLYHELPAYYHKEYQSNVAMLPVAPMDKDGNFNMGPQVSHHRAMIDNADYVIVEVNNLMPRCYGGYNETVHISEVDAIVEANNPLVLIPPSAASEKEKKIAEYVVKEICDGATIQLGIGGIPNAIGSLISKSDLKDLGIHTEMFTDSMVEMIKSGRVTGRRKNLNPGKHVFSFATGMKECYEFIAENTSCAAFPVDYTNDPFIISSHDNFIAINGALEVDLYGQVASESIGPRQISGTGGQLDFLLGSYRSKGGKGFICLTATFTKKDGSIVSRISPAFAKNTIVTTPRTITNYVVTEYGVAQLKGKSTWERAEALINIAHPQFRESLIKEAENLKIWRNSNRLR